MTVEGLELMPQGAGFDRRHGLEISGRVMVLDGIRHAIQAGMRPPAAHQKVHCAVFGIHHDVGQRQGRAGDELF